MYIVLYGSDYYRFEIQCKSIYLLIITNSKILNDEQLDKTKNGKRHTREIAVIRNTVIATRACANAINIQSCIIGFVGVFNFAIIPVHLQTQIRYSQQC